jgi:molybdopterin-guanine dinucleotide biosynthesis protein A
MELALGSSAMVSDNAILGLILNGGLGRRMGGADKGILTLAGRPMLAHVVERLASQCAALALSANGDPARFAAFGLPVLPDDPPDFAGPLAGLLAGLEYCATARPPLTHVATLPADAPFAPRDFVARLEAAREASGASIAVAASNGRMHPVAALWPLALAPALRRALVQEGVRKVEAFAARYQVSTVEWPSEPLDPFFNVNAFEDLKRAEALLASGALS